MSPDKGDKLVTTGFPHLWGDRMNKNTTAGVKVLGPQRREDTAHELRKAVNVLQYAQGGLPPQYPVPTEEQVNDAIDLLNLAMFRYPERQFLMSINNKTLLAEMQRRADEESARTQE